MIRHIASLTLGFSTLAAACKPVDAASVTTRGNSAAAIPATPTAPTFSFAHGVRIYVSAVNCEMNAQDAARVNALSRVPGITVEVVFAGVTGNDTAVVAQARADLGLTVPARVMRSQELQQYKSIGGAQLPMALMVKGRQLKTIVAGEPMPRTLSLVEASLTSTAPSQSNNTPEE